MADTKPLIFLSYAHIDTGKAIQIYQDLNRYGLDIWFDKVSLLAGQKWEREIKKAILNCDFFITLLSSKSVSKKGFIHSELKYSFNILDKYCPASKIFIIPVRLNNCKPSDADKRLDKFNWVDLFPKGNYEIGLRKILKVVNPKGVFLRSKSAKLDEGDVAQFIKRYDFYDKYKNPEGKGFTHKYREQNIKGNKIVNDETTGLMWQKGGSLDTFTYEEAEEYIEELNKNKYASYNDWRLPTLEEAMSIMEPETKKNDLYIDPAFDVNQVYILTSDLFKEVYKVWIVDFNLGYCLKRNIAYNDIYAGEYVYNYFHVRAVRLG